MKDNKQTIIIVLLIANLVLTGIFAVTIKNRINDNETMIANQLANFNQVISSMENRVTGNFQSMLDDRDDRISDAYYQYRQIDAEKNRATLDFNIELKSIGDDAGIFLSYRPAEGGSAAEVELDRGAGLTCTGSLSLSMDQNYVYDIIERTDGGGETKLNIHPYYAMLYQDFYERRIEMHGSGSGVGPKDMSIDFSFSVNNFGLDDYGLDRAVLTITMANEEIDSIDITGNLISGRDNELIQQYNLAIASGEINGDLGIDSFKEAIGSQKESEDDLPYYFYQHEIKYDADYPELNLDQDSVQNLSFRLEITCKDGYRYDTVIYR